MTSDESAEMADTVRATERRLERLHFEVCTLYTHMKKKSTNIKRHGNAYEAAGVDMMRISSECRGVKSGCIRGAVVSQFKEGATPEE